MESEQQSKPGLSVVIPGRDEVASFDVQLHIRESITTIVSMDSGQPRAAASGMTEKLDCFASVRNDA